MAENNIKNRWQRFITYDDFVLPNCVPMTGDDYIGCFFVKASKGAIWFMKLKKLPHNLTVCKIASADEIDLSKEFFFIGIFALSTLNTDYILVKEENFDNALSVQI